MKRQGLIALLTAEVVSLVGSRMSMIALPWFTLVTTGSAARTGIVAFVEMLPYVLACGLGGPLLDRLGHRRVSVAADLGSAAALIAVPVLHAGGQLHFGVLITLIGVVGLLRGLGDTAKRVVFPETVAASGMELTRATSLHDGLGRLATLLGAPLASVLIATLDASTVLAIDAATFLVAGVIVAFLVPGVRRVVAAVTDREAYLPALRAGLAFLRRDRLMLGITLLLFVTNLADAAYGTVLAPFWANDVIGSPVALGALSGVFAVGAVLGNVVFTAIAPRVPRFAVFAVGFLIAGAPRFAILSVADALWIVYVVSFVAGVSISAVNPILGAVSYERVPEHLRARVLGLGQAIGWGGMPLGSLLAGWAVQGFGLNAALLIFGGAYLAVTVLPFVSPTWRQMNRPPAAQNPAPAASAVDPAGVSR
ncbi:MFS transporter [Polymorphospora rubra]|uniref:MFS transporter n=1 Tax=Polymorphospora rubra TaxID=338584 RepID=A0A810MTE8_9ACTN|nr:MFS transporter [Polymorphospora rubra]BCJ64506.1 MFS transporter [Polymorphospora rubra]